MELFLVCMDASLQELSIESKNTIRSSSERVIGMQRHEEIKHHGRNAPACLRNIFLVLSHAPAWDFHAPAWATNMSPNLVYFKAHPRGFDGGL